MHFVRPFVKRFVLYYRTVVSPVCLSCPVLSVTLVYCGQTVGRIKMKLGMLVGLDPVHIVLNGTQLPLPKRSTTPNFRPKYGVAKRLDGSRFHLVLR